MAVIKGEESYEALESFKPILHDNKSYSLEFFLGGDYKVYIHNTYWMYIHYDILYTHVSAHDSRPEYGLLQRMVPYPQG